MCTGTHTYIHMCSYNTHAPLTHYKQATGPCKSPEWCPVPLQQRARLLTASLFFLVVHFLLFSLACFSLFFPQGKIKILTEILMFLLLLITDERQKCVISFLTQNPKHVSSMLNNQGNWHECWIQTELCIVEHAYNSGTRRNEAGGLWVWGESELHSNTLFQKKKILKRMRDYS